MERHLKRGSLYLSPTSETELRALDAEVAEKVMGYGGPFDARVAHYSTDIAAAWRVVEKMREQGHVFSLDESWNGECVGNTAEWCATFTLCPACDVSTVEDTVMLAICRAALKAAEEAEA